jgi:hypothetical protein
MAPRLPAPVVEGPPPLKRTFFTLKGHAVDTFVNEQKLPPELDSAFGGFAPVVATKPMNELIDLMSKFGHVLGETPDRLKMDFGDKRTPEMQRREAAMQKIAKSQLQKIATMPTLAAATRPQIQFSAFALPVAFFSEGGWTIENDRIEDFLTKGVKRPNRSRLEISIAGFYSNLRLLKYATQEDVEVLRRVTENDTNDTFSGARMRFYREVCRGGVPPRLIPITVSYDLCGSSTVVTVDAPTLEMRVVVLENTSNRAVELGQFHFRALDPGKGVLNIRTQAEDKTLLASAPPDSEIWYKPRILKPGEKIIVPLELLFKPGRSMFSQSKSDPATDRLRRRACIDKLLADRELQTVAIMYEGKNRFTENPVPLVPLVVLSKQKMVNALLKEPVSASNKEEFVYGPSLVLDAVDVDQSRYMIEPRDPVNVAYFSGFDIGSCPFVYCRPANGNWVKQGPILSGRSSKAREGTSALDTHVFDGTLRITEEEEETSYIDEIFVRGTLASGESITLRPTDDRVAHKDARYLVLRKGDSVDIKLSVPNGMRTDDLKVIATGYFEVAHPRGLNDD